MNINELNQFGEECTRPLTTFYKRTGNCMMNGFLGDSLQNVSFDEDGRLQFSSLKEGETTVDTKGVVLSDSILLKQTVKEEGSTGYRLYSWDVDEDRYTFLSFDNPMTMNRYFDVIKRFDSNLCDEDISLLFQEMGLKFESVNQVLLNQKYRSVDFGSNEEKDQKRPFGM